MPSLLKNVCTDGQRALPWYPVRVVAPKTSSFPLSEKVGNLGVIHNTLQPFITHAPSITSLLVLFFPLKLSQIDAFLFISCGLRQRLITAFPTFPLLFFPANRQTFFKKQTWPCISHYSSMTAHWFSCRTLQSSPSLPLYPSWHLRHSSLWCGTPLLKAL